eukprot:scaffold7346_cov245-Pinguiococcus_pyrenoidosus.AAC.18
MVSHRLWTHKQQQGAGLKQLLPPQKRRGHLLAQRHLSRSAEAGADALRLPPARVLRGLRPSLAPSHRVFRHGLVLQQPASAEDARGEAAAPQHEHQMRPCRLPKSPLDALQSLGSLRLDQGALGEEAGAKPHRVDAQQEMAAGFLRRQKHNHALSLGRVAKALQFSLPSLCPLKRATRPLCPLCSGALTLTSSPSSSSSCFALASGLAKTRRPWGSVESKDSLNLSESTRRPSRSFDGPESSSGAASASSSSSSPSTSSGAEAASADSTGETATEAGLSSSSNCAPKTSAAAELATKKSSMRRSGCCGAIVSRQRRSRALWLLKVEESGGKFHIIARHIRLRT